MHGMGTTERLLIWVLANLPQIAIAVLVLAIGGVAFWWMRK